MFCEKCGAEIDDDSSFCVSCGSIVEPENQTTSSSVKASSVIRVILMVAEIGMSIFLASIIFAKLFVVGAHNFLIDFEYSSYSIIDISSYIKKIEALIDKINSFIQIVDGPNFLYFYLSLIVVAFGYWCILMSLFSVFDKNNKHAFWNYCKLACMSFLIFSIAITLVINSFNDLIVDKVKIIKDVLTVKPVINAYIVVAVVGLVLACIMDMIEKKKLMNAIYAKNS